MPRFKYFDKSIVNERNQSDTENSVADVTFNNLFSMTEMFDLKKQIINYVKNIAHTPETLQFIGDMIALDGEIEYKKNNMEKSDENNIADQEEFILNQLKIIHQKYIINNEINTDHDIQAEVTAKLKSFDGVSFPLKDPNLMKALYDAFDKATLSSIRLIHSNHFAEKAIKHFSTCGAEEKSTILASAMNSATLPTFSLAESEEKQDEKNSDDLMKEYAELHVFYRDYKKTHQIKSGSSGEYMDGGKLNAFDSAFCNVMLRLKKIFEHTRGKSAFKSPDFKTRSDFLADLKVFTNTLVTTDSQTETRQRLLGEEGKPNPALLLHQLEARFESKLSHRGGFFHSVSPSSPSASALESLTQSPKSLSGSTV